MLTNLFSIFDPSLSLFSSSWFVLGFCLLFVFVPYWGGNMISFWSSKILFFMGQEVGYVLSNPAKGATKFITSIFLTILFFNFLALFPHIFSATSHLLVTLPLSFSFWLAIIFFSWFNFMTSFLSHLIPVGTPVGLVSFMVLVELLSNFIRPIALTFRLTANMMAGHLLMGIVGNSVVGLPVLFLSLGGALQSLLVFMELGVSLVQAYVFSVLLMLYLSEVGH